MKLKAMHRLLANSFLMCRIMAQSVARPSRVGDDTQRRQPALDSPLRVSLPAKNDERHAGNVFLAGVPVPEEREIPVNWLRSTSSSMYSPHSWRATTYQDPEFLKKLLEYLVVTQSSSKEWIIGLQIERITQMSIEISVMRAVLPLRLCRQARMWWRPSQRTYPQPSCLTGSCNLRPLKKGLRKPQMCGATLRNYRKNVCNFV